MCMLFLFLIFKRMIKFSLTKLLFKLFFYSQEKIPITSNITKCLQFNKKMIDFENLLIGQQLIGGIVISNYFSLLILFIYVLKTFFFLWSPTIEQGLHLHSYFRNRVLILPNNLQSFHSFVCVFFFVLSQLWALFVFFSLFYYYQVL